VDIVRVPPSRSDSRGSNPDGETFPTPSIIHSQLLWLTNPIVLSGSINNWQQPELRVKVLSRIGQFFLLQAIISRQWYIF